MSVIGTIINHKNDKYVVIAQAPSGYWVQLDSDTRNDVFDSVSLKYIRANTVGHLVKGANFFTLKNGKAVEVMHQVGDVLFVRHTATKWKVVSEQEGAYLTQHIVRKVNADEVGLALPARNEYSSLYEYIQAGKKAVQELIAKGLLEDE